MPHHSQEFQRKTFKRQYGMIIEYFDIILSYIKSGKILRSQPQPGHVYATSFRNAGYSGRKHLYLIGLS